VDNGENVSCKVRNVGARSGRVNGCTVRAAVGEGAGNALRYVDVSATVRVQLNTCCTNYIAAQRDVAVVGCGADADGIPRNRTVEREALCGLDIYMVSGLPNQWCCYVHASVCARINPAVCLTPAGATRVTLLVADTKPPTETVPPASGVCMVIESAL